MVSSLVSMVIVFLRTVCTCDHFLARQFIEIRDSNSIFVIFHLNLANCFSGLKINDKGGSVMGEFGGSKKDNFSVT